MEIDGGSDKIGERPTKVMANQATKKVRFKEVEMEDTLDHVNVWHEEGIELLDFDVMKDTKDGPKLKGMVDYMKALSEGLWVIYDCVLEWQRLVYWS
ncbi:hypothetical protein GOBAR_AA22557 [Gossypium barbadense]|uniref:Uncharacterized protein n=1 Tax=Gossypium barbadense TaxID=3634 RepID=A0A2P5X464_GOSBA|nr:hypothetical protein GOBAR_AA22557 [Gossypium barbadense]